MTNDTMTNDQLTLEEKVDKILSYQKSMHRWAIVRGVVSFLLFLIFVVLPIIGIFYFVDSMKDSPILGQFSEAIQKLKDAPGEIQKLNEALGESSR